MDLPSSFLVSKSSSKYCAIEYNLSVTAKPQNEKLLLGLGQVNITMKAASVPNEIVPATITPDALRIEAQGMYQSSSMGTLGVAARVEDVHVGRGDRLDIYLACINDAEVKVQSVKMSLVEQVSWNTQLGRRVCEKEIELASIKNLHLPGVERKPTVARSCTEVLLQLLQSPANKVNIDIPHDCLDSYYSGKVVKIRHFIKTKFQTPIPSF